MNSLPFGIIDICFVAILVISGILAYIRGFVREVLSVAAWVGAAFVTLYGYPHLQPFARAHIENRMIADVAAGGIEFIRIPGLASPQNREADRRRDRAPENQGAPWKIIVPPVHGLIACFAGHGQEHEQHLCEEEEDR